MAADPRAVIAQVYTSISDSYDTVGVQFFSVFARQLVDDVDLRPGERVLDVGTGAGAALLEAAAKVAPGGSALGIDLAPGMVARATASVAERGLTNARVQLGDAQEPGLPLGSYDAVTAALMVFFLPDPAAGVRAWHDVLVPGGRLGLTTFGGDDARWSWQDEVFAPYTTEQLRRRPHASLFSSSDRLHGLLTDAGFVQPTSTIRLHEVVFADAEQWVRFSQSNGQRAFWDRVPPRSRAGLYGAVHDHLAAIAEPDGSIVLRQPIRYTLAYRAT